MLDRLRAEGVEIVENARASKVVKEGGWTTVRTAEGAAYRGSHLLIAFGRKVDLDRLNLEVANMRVERKGLADKGLRSISNRRVCAIADAAGGMRFTHLAGYRAGLVIRSALVGMPATARSDHIPRVTFTTLSLLRSASPRTKLDKRIGGRTWAPCRGRL